MAEPPPELLRFVHGEMDAASFRHADHVRLGFEMLRRHDFAETVYLYSRALRGMAPQAFHHTITIASLSLIAERMALEDDFPNFAARNPDLFEKSTLLSRYSPERLTSDAARRTFLLPA
jgi:hypothetical protein